MPNMPAKLTRLELVIIVSALVVLLFSNQPPEPGNADTRSDVGQATESLDSIPLVQPERIQPETPRAEVAATRPPASPMPDNQVLPSIPSRPTKKFGKVDARRCDPVKYPNIMYGPITVRWVWNGTKFEPCKVCEVKESNGIVTVWSFDEHEENMTITEVSEDEVPRY